MESKEAVKERVRRYRERKRNEAGTAKGTVTVTKCNASVTPVTGICNACNDKDTANTILRAKVLMLEKELALLKRERKVEKQDEPKSPYRLGPGV